MKMKTIGLGVVAVVGTVILLGYPVILSTLFVTESGTKLGGFWFITLSIVTVYAVVRLIIWLISQFVRMIRG